MTSRITPENAAAAASARRLALDLVAAHVMGEACARKGDVEVILREWFTYEEGAWLDDTLELAVFVAVAELGLSVADDGLQPLTDGELNEEIGKVVRERLEDGEAPAGYAGGCRP